MQDIFGRSSVLIDLQEYDRLVFTTGSQAGKSSLSQILSFAHGAPFFSAIGSFGRGRIGIQANQSLR